jgi:two-component system, NtrC family, nitrogen regulation sensor histidine kinase NtrY
MFSIKKFFKNNSINKTRLQDIIFISGILIFFAALVLIFFPENTQEDNDQDYFSYLMLVIPVFAAIYFIFISFSRKYFSGTPDFSSSIIFKMMMAFISVAVLPSFAIIIISNHIINATVSDLITEETVYALNESVDQSNEFIQNICNDIDNELKTIEYTLENKTINPDIAKDRIILLEQSKIRGFSCSVFSLIKKDNRKNIIKRKNVNLAADESDIDKSGIFQFFEFADLNEISRISNISIKKKSLILGHIIHSGYIIAVSKIIPEYIYDRLNVFSNSLNRYNKREFLKPYFQTGVGLLFLSIALIIFLVSVGLSFFLSRGIARPILKLADAVGEVASGNFQVSFSNNSTDEVGRLSQTFNTMVKQLNESRELAYHTQRLEAWKEVARRLVHEIKNPLTPIRLSAERIQNRFREGHKDIDKIVISGTETIIEEVNVLNRILNEFSGFARLPEVKAEFQDLNRVIENTVNFFLGNEKITFHLNLDRTLPDIYIDKILIRQALTNIIQNSIDALENKGNIFIETVLPVERNLSAKLSVIDDGPGIKSADIGKIFDPAFTTKENGTGLGLAIVEKIIIEHKARIHCIPNKSKGAEFVIEFPVSGKPA